MRLAEEVCRERLAAADRAFLASTGEDLRPHLVPVVFTVSGDELLIAIDQKPKSTTDLRRLRNIAWNPQVAILVDRYDADWRHLWWVRADGRARVDASSPSAIELLAAKYPQYVADPPRGPGHHGRHRDLVGLVFQLT
ncbi:TIGR03668 family PPOX class F420-dependent oxidoreductase [Streptomyces sp. SID13031]|uniref:TIGR03668 family PPOX class F420-dependent oxidoreductase n=1 Tax=Streptomyces sp. SID13031 TaxID=2706046 RepID=UPI0031BB11A6